jgi:hypothetical protein
MTFAMGDPSKQLDLFPSNEPEIKGQLVAFAVVLENLIDLMMRKGVLTKDEALSLCRHSEIKSGFAIWENLTGEIPPSDLKSMEAQATKFIAHLREKIG